MTAFSPGGCDDDGQMYPAYFDCECGFSLEWPVTEGLAPSEDPTQTAMLRLRDEHLAACLSQTSALAGASSTAPLAADAAGEAAALPQAQQPAVSGRLGPGHLLCHTCKKACIERDPKLMAEFERRHAHHDKEDLRDPRYFEKPDRAVASPAFFAERSAADRRISAFNQFSSAAHRFDRELAVIRSLDRTGQLDAGLAHLESAWAGLERDYAALQEHLSQFVAREYYSRDHAAVATLTQNAEAAS